MPSPSAPPSPSTLAAVPGSGPRMAGLGWNAGPGLLLSATLAAVPGLGPRVAAGGRTAGPGLLRFYVTLAAPPPLGPTRGWRRGITTTRTATAEHSHTLAHPPFSHTQPPPPPPSLCTFIIIPPAAIDKPQGFLVRGFPPRGAAGVHAHLTLSHASHPLTNLSDSPPAGKGTCCLPSRAQETPSEPPRWSVLPSQPPAASSRCWSRPDVSPDIKIGVPPRCCRRGGRGLQDCTPPPLPPPPPHQPNPTYTAHAHIHTLTIPGLPLICEAKLCSTVVSLQPHVIL